ncbi:MAG: GIY-YIG nuclease family protein [Gemmatimonadaceae bacterium]|nr:GIY-YIG nuclease family protein [Gemmatimonadaceae bacterium]
MPTCAGVYAIYESGLLSYIGSAGNLRWRLRTHLRGDRFKAPIHVKVKRTVNSEAARAIERRLIGRLRPSHNKVINVAVKVRPSRPANYPYDWGLE